MQIVCPSPACHMILLHLFPLLWHVPQGVNCFDILWNLQLRISADPVQLQHVLLLGWASKRASALLPWAPICCEKTASAGIHSSSTNFSTFDGIRGGGIGKGRESEILTRSRVFFALSLTNGRAIIGKSRRYRRLCVSIMYLTLDHFDQCFCASFGTTSLILARL